ncbi:MAG: hydroxyisourate hydrolase [Comamonas sp.]|uniref:hydroxyisourate hydrolase n=1 Tax=Comamonas sp. TaxID=34028 RepID=UPI00281A87F6|nr:hydroxyisourate hydrolase [Comamonas sp.]MDR0214140.1 hydroxyisourate hydrolase [Comamonas sp.]MDR2299185.1 hydroxyisourate hydrolase [Comamonas sp.]
MQSTKPLAPSRRQFALSGLALGASALTAARGALAADAPAASTAPAQSSGPIVLHGVSPRLTVHTIDTFHGMAATGLRIDFSRFDGEAYVPVRSFTINANGRADEPLLIDDSYRAGRYELLLHVDEYFAAKGAKLPRPAFLSKLPVRFQITNVAERIHLPIQFGPWSYTYSRGS